MLTLQHNLYLDTHICKDNHSCNNFLLEMNKSVLKIQIPYWYSPKILKSQIYSRCAKFNNCWPCNTTPVWVGWELLPTMLCWTQFRARLATLWCVRYNYWLIRAMIFIAKLEINSMKYWKMPSGHKRKIFLVLVAMFG